MSNLDEKIRYIFREEGSTPGAIALVKQAFIDAGWKYDPIERVRYNAEAENYSDRFPRLMTGQEWYDRFEKEFHQARPFGGVSQRESQLQGEVISAADKAAKKAAGIE